MPTGSPTRRSRSGFTLIELIVVMAVIALLVSIVAPRYLVSVERAREQSLKTSLRVMRDAIDQFAGDRGRYPDSLEELVKERYLRSIPDDPVLGRRDRWVTLPPAADGTLRGKVLDVRSGAAGRGLDESLYADW